MAKYYHIDKQSITVKPFAFLIPVGLSVVALLLAMPLTIILIMVKGNIGDIETQYFAGYIIMLPLILACIPFFTYGKRKVIFDAFNQAVYLKTIYSKKQLMSFDQVASIDPQVRFGLAYYLKSKDDRFGKGYRISPSFSNEGDKDKKHYDSLILSAIKNMISLKAVKQVIVQPNPIDLGILTYYIADHNNFRLKHGGSVKYLPALIFFGFFACYFWYNLFTKMQLTDSDRQLSVIVLIPIMLFVLTITKRIVFDVDTQKIKVYRIGLLFKSYTFDKFAGFSIVRKTYNGLYNGTDVRLKFKKPSGTSELTLADFGKTNPIENFIAETEYILDRMKNHERSVN
ncbi:hypothetical protein FFJ24_001425 [Pedobacter sp. KBS0701]|uniref:hypothetical protein n=1 Tax=Pedobacter sp. KBS0701 TaxID=2578106 RepID=UPI00110E68FF|nr:hypothetical protein [Pedobacter sp. KBS0701]QDW23557.1 hypothetical protein FFJ24_001425 [Pedobacter sp. KBS0701]